MIIDQFGHCIKCGKNLITQKVYNAPEGLVSKTVFVPDYGQIQFLLDDGSKMRVVMCLPCQAVYDEKDNKNVMKSVIAGWQKEVRELKHWNKEKKEKHMKIYKKKKIKHKVKEFKYEINSKK